MKKLTNAVAMVAIMLFGVVMATESNLPPALHGVDLQGVQKIADSEAQNIRGAADSFVTPQTRALAQTQVVDPVGIQKTPQDRTSWP